MNVNDSTDSPLVVIRTFTDEMAAQLAKVLLEAFGIEATIKKDDCGGWGGADMWLVEGVHVAVRAEDASAARHGCATVSTASAKADITASRPGAGQTTHWGAATPSFSPVTHDDRLAGALDFVTAGDPHRDHMCTQSDR